MFGGACAVRDVLVAMRTASADPEQVYEINDYHMILLYYALETCCEIYNDMMRDELDDEDSELTVLAEGKPLRKADAGIVSDTFFPDTDFLGMVNLFNPRIPQTSLDALGFRECTAAAHNNEGVQREARLLLTGVSDIARRATAEGAGDYREQSEIPRREDGRKSSTILRRRQKRGARTCGSR